MGPHATACVTTPAFPVFPRPAERLPHQRMECTRARGACETSTPLFQRVFIGRVSCAATTGARAHGHGSDKHKHTSMHNASVLSLQGRLQPVLAVLGVRRQLRSVREVGPHVAVLVAVRELHQTTTKSARNRGQRGCSGRGWQRNAAQQSQRQFANAQTTCNRRGKTDSPPEFRMKTCGSY